MKKKAVKQYGLGNNIKYAIKMLMNKDKIVVFLLVVSILVEMLISLTGVYFPKFVLEQIELNIEPSKLIIRILLFTIVIGCLYFASKFINTKVNWHLVTIQAEYVWDLYVHSITCPYTDIASAKGQNKYQRAKDSVFQGDTGCIRTMIPAILNISIGILGAVVYTFVLLHLNWWIPLLLIMLSLLSISVSSYCRYYEQSRKDNWVKIDKKLNYFINKCADPAWGKDIRLFSMQKWLFDIIAKCLKDRGYWYNKVETRKTFALICNSIVILIRDGASYVYLILCVAKGQISISDFVLYFNTIAGFSQWISKIVDQISLLGAASNLVSDFRGFMELDSEKEEDNKRQYRDLGSGIEKIEFKDVSFSYGNNKNVIEHLNLVIDKGEKIGLVGINGAGKTTFVNLLCGLYEPKQGEILINGFPKSDYNPNELRKKFSTVFQDSNVFPFTIAENISMREKKSTDLQKVLSCLETADLVNKIKNTKNGIESPVLKVTDNNGLIMSGGEMQKLYLARALYKNGDVVILDEPMAALDPIAEKYQYLQYEKICKDKIAIYISHRLSSTSFCDKIAFLENGKITEYGSHDELIKLSGKYYEMFEVQRQYYKEDNTKENGNPIMIQETVLQ